MIIKSTLIVWAIISSNPHAGIVTVMDDIPSATDCSAVVRQIKSNPETTLTCVKRKKYQLLVSPADGVVDTKDIPIE